MMRRYLAAHASAYRWAASRCAERAGLRLGSGAGALPRPVFRLSGGRVADPRTAVALTFDDGPHPDWTPLVLDLLARHAVPATFFLVGQRVLESPALARRIMAEQHSLGNHTMRHVQPFAALPVDRLWWEIGQAADAIAAATGHRPRLIRAPAGGWSTDVLRIAGDLGLTPVDWTVDPKDWRPRRHDRIARTLVASSPGDIILCHDGGGDRSQTVRALETAIPILRSRGLTFVAL